MTIWTKDFVKDPLAIKDYIVDWTSWLAGDTISSSTWQLPAGITDVQDSIVSGSLKTTIWLSGGTVQTQYEIFNTIVTAGGRTERALLKVLVR